MGEGSTRWMEQISDGTFSQKNNFTSLEGLKYSNGPAGKEFKSETSDACMQLTRRLGASIICVLAHVKNKPHHQISNYSPYV